MFNKHQFLDDLTDVILENIKNDIVNDIDEVHDIIYHEIDNECIYTYNSFEICMAMNFVNWENSELPVNNICQAAYVALSEYVNDELNMKVIEEVLQARLEYGRN
jgi:hypothetical protein